MSLFPSFLCFPRAIVGAALLASVSSSAQTIDLESPNAQVRARFTAEPAGVLTYVLEFDSHTVIASSRIGIEVDGNDLGTSVTIGEPAYAAINEAYPQRGMKDRSLNRGHTLSLPLTYRPSGQAMILEARAYDNGFAWRLRVPGEGVHQVQGEATTWTLPERSRVWFAERNSDWKLKTYAGEWISADIDALPTISRQGPVQGPPLIVELPQRAGFALLTEAALANYSGMRLRAIGERRLQADFTEGKAGFAVNGPITTPWRVTLLNRDLNGLVNNDVISSLNPPPDPVLFTETGYIKPGRCVWRWWSVGTGTPAEERQFIGYAAELGFEYSMIDEGWAKWSNPWQELRSLADEGKRREVGIIIWSDVKELRDPAGQWQQLRQFLDQARDAGVAAVKLDFINSESRESIDFEMAALRLAAERQLMVIFHGVQKPTGEPRTYPNEITREGIRGLELNKIMTETVIPASHNAALPFTRLVVGHGDYTPLGYSRPGATTWAHQLATVVQFTSPLQVIGEHPDMLLHNPDTRPGLDVLKAIPAVWDETRVLEPSRIGELSIIARRKDESWFLAILTGTGPVRLDQLDLSFLGDKKHRLVQISSPTPTTLARKESVGVNQDTQLAVDLAGADGLVCWFQPETPALAASLPAAAISRTPDGMEIQARWRTARPQAGAAAAGFPTLTAAQHVTLFSPTREQGAYNHHAELIWHQGKFHAMWSNHPFTEDGTGQRVLFTSSTNPWNWPAAQELFPPPATVRPKAPAGTPLGVHAAALTWLVQDDRLFAVAAINTIGPIAREIMPNGELGPVFRLWLRDSPLPFVTLSADDPSVTAIAGRLRAAISSPECWPWWDFWDRFAEPDAVNGRKLIEPTVHRAADGRWVMLLRDTGWGTSGTSHRLFMSVSSDGLHWPPAAPTDIPDSPSRHEVVTLGNGTSLLLGNQVAPEFDRAAKGGHPRDPLTVAVSRDGYHFDRVYALRWDLPKTMRISGVTGRGPGAQYPSGIVHDGILYVLYTIGKEDVALSWVPLESLQLN